MISEKMSVLEYPVRLCRDPNKVEVHIRDASNRIIAANLIGRDAAEIVQRMNGYTNPVIRLTKETQTDWERHLDALGFSKGFKDRLSQCVNNLDEFFGLTPAEALQQGWLDYPD
jgi:hypothetical protein